MKLSRRCTLQLLAASASFAATSSWARAPLNKGQSLVAAEDQGGSYKIKRLIHSACYYPELWPAEDIDRDIAEMQKLGINTVRMGEFGWSLMEPKEGRISVDFFRLVMDKFHVANIGVVFCTPTATPPVWLTYEHPERLFVNAEGETLIHGARQHASYEHPVVRKACMRVVEACAKAIGNHPALVAWQIDNELKCHIAEDFSKAAIANWHQWLKHRFVTIDALNEAWGTHMWSEHYQSFEQVPAPLKTPFMHNASLSTAYRMFNRERIAEFSDEQCAIIRRYSNAPISHNTNPGFSVNHERLFKNLDFAAFDAYPSSQGWSSLVFRSDMYRAAKPGRPFWLMETSASYNGWLGEHSPAHPEGFLVAEAVLLYGLGSEAFSYWLWRQQRTGVEIAHSAVMSAWFKPGTGYEQVKKVEAARKQLEPLLLASKPQAAEIAITWSDHARAMIETEPFDKSDGFPTNYQGLIEQWHTAVRNQGYFRDVRYAGAELRGLKLLMTPAMPYVSDEFLARVKSFVSDGGIWLIGPGTGTRTAEHAVPVDAGLGKLEALAGVVTEFIFPLTGTGATGTAFNQTFPLTGWCAAVKTVDDQTQVLGKLNAEQAPGASFFTERSFGKGKVVLMSAHPVGDAGKTFLEALIQHYAKEAQVSPPIIVSAGTVVCPRVDQQGRSLWVVVNMDGKGGSLKTPAGTTDALNGQPVTTIELKRYEWRVLKLTV